MTDQQPTIDLSKPVIWTSKGNLNESDVAKFCEWSIDPVSGLVVFVLGARLKSTGEIVKRGVYACPPALIAQGAQADIA